MASPSIYLTPKSLAARLDTSPRLLGRWRATGLGPRWLKAGERTIRYPLAEVEAWEAARLRGEVPA